MTADDPNGGDGPAPAASDAQLDRVRIVLRPMASPAPLGFVAFAVGTVLLTALQLHWVPLGQTTVLSVLLLGFVGPPQVVAGLLAYAARDGGLATMMLTFGAVWVSLALAMRSAPPGSRSPLLGIFLLTAATVLLGLGLMSMTVRPLLSGLALLAPTRYALTGCYELTGTAGVQYASGWVGVPLVLIALYGAIAFLLEGTRRRPVLPLGRRKDARTALEGAWPSRSIGSPTRPASADSSELPSAAERRCGNGCPFGRGRPVGQVGPAHRPAAGDHRVARQAQQRLDELNAFIASLPDEGRTPPMKFGHLAATFGLHQLPAIRDWARESVTAIDDWQPAQQHRPTSRTDETVR